MEIIQKWSVENRCIINESKTKIVLVRKNSRAYPEGETVQGFEIVKTFKYLGFHLDSSLTLNVQIKEMKERVQK